MIRIIAKRYAKAFVELSQEKKTVDKAKGDLASFLEAVDAQPAMQRVFASPAVTPENKKAVAAEVASRLGLQPTTKRFIEHLAETGRIRYIREVSRAFSELLDERQNRASATLVSAAPLAAGDLSDIKKSLEGVTGKTVEIEAKVDPSLIGGVRAQIGSVVYDGTIKTQLGRMRERLVK